MKLRSAIHGLVVTGALLTSVGAGIVSCHSVYRRAEAQLPADLNKRLSLRVKTARDAAANGIVALEGKGNAELAEAAQWDLDKGADSVGDVLERLPQPDSHAESLHLILEDAADALNSAVETLEADANAIGDPSIQAARDALKTAVNQADAYLLEVKDR